MRMISKEVDGEKIVLTVEKKILFYRVIVKYEATEQYPKGYWNWTKLPNKTLISDAMSFQLDSWCRGASES